MTKSLMIAAGYLHALGVATYLGGSIVMEFVLGPVQRAIPPAQAQIMGEKAAGRFLVLAWGALGLILASGLSRLYLLHMLPTLGSAALLSSSYGRTVFTMIVLWAVLVVNGAIMTFGLRPKMSIKMTAAATPEELNRRRLGAISAAEWANSIARIDLGLVLVVALLGASLRFGGIV